MKSRRRWQLSGDVVRSRDKDETRFNSGKDTSNPEKFRGAVGTEDLTARLLYSDNEVGTFLALQVFALKEASLSLSDKRIWLSQPSTEPRR
jgi:hypothetical protein